VAFAITFFFISPGSSFLSSPNRITNVWHSDLVRTEYIAPRSLPINRFVPSFGPIINRRVSPLPLYAPVVRPYFVPVPVLAATEAPTLPPPTTTEAVTTTTAAATTLPPPPPPTTTAAPVEVETEAPAAIEEAPAPPAVVEAPAAPPAAPQVITIQQPAAQGGFPQGIIAVQPIISHGGFLNIGDGGVSAPGGISQFSALLQALLGRQAPAPAAPVAPLMTEAPAPATTIAPAPETTAAPTLPPTTLAPPTPVHYIPALPNIVLQPPQAFQHQAFNQLPAAPQQVALPVISPVDDQKFLIKVEDAHANQEKRNLRYDGQNEYGYSVSQSHGQGGQSYPSYAQNNAVAPGSAYYGQQQLHPAQGPAETQQVYSNQVHVSYILSNLFCIQIEQCRQLAKL
jgi:hypothetical protein